MSDLNAPIDPLNAECARARRVIRAAFMDARARAVRRGDLMAEELEDSLVSGVAHSDRTVVR